MTATIAKCMISHLRGSSALSNILPFLESCQGSKFLEPDDREFFAEVVATTNAIHSGQGTEELTDDQVRDMYSCLVSFRHLERGDFIDARLNAAYESWKQGA